MAIPFTGPVKDEDSLRKWIGDNLFNLIPIAVAVIDRNYDLVYANKTFEEMFGAWRNRKCFSVYKKRGEMCLECKGSKAFNDGLSVVNEEIGFNKNGRLTRYIKHTIPIADNEGNVNFLLEMSTDTTEVDQIRKENQLLFEQVPCNIIILDKDLRVVKSNQKVKETFGDIKGEHCYEVFKKRKEVCQDCAARRTFKDGRMCTGRSSVINKKGENLELHITTVPFNMVEGRFDMVMEMGVDITPIIKLRDELRVAHNFMAAMISSSVAGIIAMDENEVVNVVNPAAKKMFNIRQGEQITKADMLAMFPDGFMDRMLSEERVSIPEATLNTLDGGSFPGGLDGINIMSEGEKLGATFWARDRRRIKQLEDDKLEAERLAAVGQTVAGLAHGVKNLITGLEGGMYMLTSGINKGNGERVEKGMGMLQRNVARISAFVREFLNFAKGRRIEAKLADPGQIAKEVVDLYLTKAEEIGIELMFEYTKEVEKAPMDAENLHECLTNIVANAIDACRISEEQREYHVWVRVFEKDGVVIFEVKDDGCGMDYEVKKKVFTNFFTTKGTAGTGIGLLMTKKIVQEHGGNIQFESEPEQGSTFRINLPRKRLPALSD